jgi:hypothetical protein
MRSAIILPVLVGIAAASKLKLSNLLVPRQDGCPSDELVCGQSCITFDEDCCPDGSYCLSGEVCGLADNDVYGCCPLGETCSGDAAQSTITDSPGSFPTNIGGGGGDLSSLNSDFSSIDRSLNGEFSSLTFPTTFPSGTFTGFGGTPTAGSGSGGSGGSNGGGSSGNGGGSTVTHLGGVGGLMGSGAGAMQTAAAVAVAAFALL